MSEKIKTIEDRIADSVRYADSRLAHELLDAPNSDAELSARMFGEFLEHEPKIVEKYVAENAVEQKRAFLAGEIRTPDHHYDRLEGVDYESQIEQLELKGRAMLLNLDGLRPMEEKAYRDVTNRFVGMTRLMQTANDYNHATNEAEKDALKAEYARYNKEIYGEPDEPTYRSLLAKRLAAIDARELTEEQQVIREELGELMAGMDVEDNGVRAFEPSQETVDWMHDIVMHLYGPWLRHIPEDQSSFTREEVRSIFQSIIDNEFGEAAEGWEAVILKATSINVRALEKQVRIPETLPDVKLAHLKRLIVHEFGAHMIHAVVGSDTNHAPLQYGTASYSTPEEGLGVVNEDALEGKFINHGEPAYIIAGLNFFDGKDFRDAYEIWWRIAALSPKLRESAPDTPLEKKKDLAYNAVNRIFRGTDDLPMFKDLSYRNGPDGIWKFLEKHRGDDLLFMLLVTGGKIDPNNQEDVLLALEARSK